MSRTDSSFGVRNFTQIITGSSETPLLSPSVYGVCASFPTPLFPLSTATYPVGVFAGFPANMGQTIDGHPFEVNLVATISGNTTTNVLVNLYNVAQSSWIKGPYDSSYTIGTLGSGCTNVVTGTATSGITSSVSVNFWMKAQFVYSSVTKILGFGTAAQYLNGSVVAVSASANATGLTLFDLNFIPSFTFASGGTNTVTVTEFSVARL